MSIEWWAEKGRLSDVEARVLLGECSPDDEPVLLATRCNIRSSHIMDMIERENDLRALALSLAEALESAKPVYANALQVAIDMMRSGEPWSDVMADKMRAVVSDWCEQANAALASPALVKLKGGE